MAGWLHRVPSLACLGLLLALAAGCGGPPLPSWLAASPTPAAVAPAPRPADAPAARGTLRLVGGDPQSLDPALSQDSTSRTYVLHVFGGLVTLDAALQVVPDLAESWRVSDDGRTYTFRLRPDARFHDGRPVTSADVRYSLERALDPRLRSPVARTYLGDILGAEARLDGRASDVAGIATPDERTVALTVVAPRPYFLAKLTYPTAFVVDRANVERGGRWAEQPNGTGPFRLASYERGRQLVLTANPAYHGGPPGLARVEFDLAPGSAIARYERDEVDVVEVGPADVERVTDPRGALSGELNRILQMSLAYVGLGVRQPPFDDPQVRLAFAYATDRRRLAEVLLKKMRLPAAGILPPGMPGYDPALVGLEFSPEKARRTLATSRYGSPAGLPPITLSIGGRGGGLGESLAEMYRRNLGVEVEVETVEQGYLAGLAARQYQMFYLGWIADYPDPENFLDVLFHSQSEANHSGYADAEVDRLLERARSEPDVQARLRLYQEAERRIVAAAPVIPLAFDSDYVLSKPRVRGLVWTSLGLLSLREVTVE